jgi:16S rRNA (uracil1498-N3)-methyltransferase
MTAAAHVLVADVNDPHLEPAERHHLARVLRLRAGAPITIGDGRGRWRPMRFGAVLEVAGAVVAEPPPATCLTLAFALLKGDRPELVVQKLTEIGVDTIVPMVTDRTVVRWDEARAVRHRERLTLVARVAAMQSRRVWVPAVEPLQPFAVVASRPGAVLAERGGAHTLRAGAVVMVGPEGGWSPAEQGAGISRIGLGPNVLRAETAAIVAAALLMAGRDATNGHGQ